jgi:hypothetical protein
VSMPVRKGPPECAVQPGDVFRPNQGRRASCAVSACAMFAEVLSSTRPGLSEEEAGEGGQVGAHLMTWGAHERCA